MSALGKKDCVPCQVGAPPLTLEGIQVFMGQLGVGWQLVEEKRIEKTYILPSFVKALEFVQRIGEVAEREGHHPDLHIHYDRVRVELWTHKINGLHENDFILAAKIDELLSD